MPLPELATSGIIILFVAGAVLILVELLTPTVIFGLFGLGCIVVAIVLGYVTHPGTSLGLWLTLVALVLLPTFVVVWVKVLGRYFAVKSTEAGYDSSETGLKELLGAEGVTVTKLRPAGMARFGDRRVDVVSNGEIIEKDARIKVIDVRGNRVVVRMRQG